MHRAAIWGFWKVNNVQIGKEDIPESKVRPNWWWVYHLLFLCYPWPRIKAAPNLEVDTGQGQRELQGKPSSSVWKGRKEISWGSKRIGEISRVFPPFLFSCTPGNPAVAAETASSNGDLWVPRTEEGERYILIRRAVSQEDVVNPHSYFSLSSLLLLGPRHGYSCGKYTAQHNS